MRLIGLNGKKGSGKDTAGTYLVQRYGFTRLSFALDLKRSAAAVLGLPADNGEAFFEQLKNNPKARLVLYVDDIDTRGQELRTVLVDISVREYLQFYGTEGHRDIFGADFWTRILLERLDADGNYVITDARFANECGAVRAVGGSIIVIDRPGSDTTDMHASEEDLPPDLVDTVVYNHGSIQDLYLSLDAYMAIEDERSVAGVSVAQDGVSIDLR